MRVRPGVTIEEVLEAHESIEREHPPGSKSRGRVLEQYHQLLLDFAVSIRLRRQAPNKRDFAKVVTLLAMADLDLRTEEKMSFRDLARGVLGEPNFTGRVERLAREYANLDPERNAAPGRVKRVLSRLKCWCKDRTRELSKDSLVGR